MRKLFLFLLPVAMLLVAGCTPKQEEPVGLSVDPELITCPDVGGDYTVTVSSPNGEWSATPSDSWIRVNPASGEQGSAEVRIRIETNRESVESLGKITFVSGEEKVEMPVSRAAKAAPYLRVLSEKELNTPKEGGSYTVKVESNIKWQIASNTGWAKVDKGVSINNDRITVTVSPATTPEETKAYIVVSPYGEGYEAGRDTVLITRGSTDATSLTVDPTEVNAPEKGGSFTVNVSTNAQWRVWKTWDMDWVTLNEPAEGNGNGSFSFSIEEATSLDAVSGILTIEEVRSDHYKPVVTQVAVCRKGKAAADLTVAPTSITSPAEGGSFPVAIKSNYPWTASVVGAKFISVSTTSGEGYTNMVVTIKPATDTVDVTGSITIKTTFGGEQARINIKREGKEPEPELASGITVYPEQAFATEEGGSTVISVSANCAWTVTSYDKTMATVAPASGNGNGSFTIRILPSTPKGALRSYVAVTSADGSVQKTILVRREKYKTKLALKPFSVKSNKQVYFSPGNLLYTQATQVWSFAEYQYDSYGLSGGIWELFGWGTGDQPTATTVEFTYIEDLSLWGNNRIAYQDLVFPAGTWRTMDDAEWSYLLFSRPNADQLRGAACINGVNGYVLLPDNWQAPEPSLNLVGNTNNYAANVYTPADWIKMEANGAVFLPASGYRYNYALGETQMAGYYWTNEIKTSPAGWMTVEMQPEYFKFYYNSPTDNGCAMEHGERNFHSGCAVRLVMSPINQNNN